MYLNFYILLEMTGKNLGYCENPTLARFLNQLGSLLSQLKYGYDKNFSTLVNSTRGTTYYSLHHLSMLLNSSWVLFLRQLKHGDETT